MLCSKCERFCELAWKESLSADKSSGSRQELFEFKLHETLRELSDAVADACSLCSLIQRGLSNELRQVGIEASGVYLSLSSRSWRGIAAPFLLVSLRHSIDDDGGPGKGARAKIELHALPKSSEHLASVIRECSEMKNDKTSSDCSFKLARSWLEDCMQHHVTCAEFQGTDLAMPTRAIHVGPSDGSQEPVLLNTCGMRHQYITLSHCWGGTDVLSTTAETMAERENGIPISSMPQTFRDAVTIARKFGISFLWIDSLCIIQDSPEDWEYESSRMWDTYRNAAFTIAAQHATSSAGGCFVQRDESLPRPCLLRFFDDLQQKSNRGLLMCASLVEPGTKFENWPTKTPKFSSSLDSRAWVMQEQVLSTRLLQYHEGWVSWHCLDMDASEIVPAGIKTIKILDYVGILQTGLRKDRHLFPQRDLRHATGKNSTTLGAKLLRTTPRGLLLTQPID